MFPEEFYESWAGEWVPPDKRAKRLLATEEVLGAEFVAKYGTSPFDAWLYGATEDFSKNSLASPR